MTQIGLHRFPLFMDRLPNEYLQRDRGIRPKRDVLRVLVF